MPSDNWWEDDSQPAAAAESTGGWWEPEAPPAPPAADLAGGVQQGSITTPALPQSAMQALTDQPFPALPELGAEAIAQRDPEIMAQRLGIEPGGAPRDLTGYYQQIPPGMRDDAVKYMVERYFQKQSSSGEAAPVDVQFSGALGTHIYRDPHDGKWRPLNDLGLDTDDLKDFAKYVLAPTAAAGVAGIGGTLALSPVGGGAAAVAADLSVSAGMRKADVQELVDLGLLPPSVSPWAEAGKEATWSLGANIAGAGAGRILRRLVAGPLTPPMAVDIDRRTVKTMLDRWESEFAAGTPPGAEPTLADKMAMVADRNSPREVAAAQRVRQRVEALTVANETRTAMLERAAQNKEAVQQGLQKFLNVVGRQDVPEVYRSSGISRQELLDSSLKIINELEAPARQALKNYDESLTNAYSDAQRTVDTLLADAHDPTRLPSGFRGVFDEARENFRTNMASRYDEVAEATQGQRVFDIAPLNTDLTALRRRLQADQRFRSLVFGEWAPALTQRSRFSAATQPAQIPDDDLAEVFFGERFRRDPSGIMLPDPARREMAANTMHDYKTINSALLELRKNIRKMPSNSDPDTMAVLSRLESTLEQVRLDGVNAIDPALGPQQQALDAAYKLGLDTLDRSVMKKLTSRYLEPRPGLEGRMQPSTFQAMFKGDAGAETIRDIRTLEINDIFDAGPDHPLSTTTVRDTIRRSLMGELNRIRRPVEGRGGRAEVFDPSEFATFRRDYQDALEYVFPREQLDKIQSAASLRQALLARENDAAAVREKVMNFPWGRDFAVDDPTQLFNKTWGQDATRIQRNQQLREALRERGDPPELMTSYRRLIAQDMMSDVTDRDGVINFDRLRDYLHNNQELLATWYTTRRDAKSGQTLVSNMDTYARIGQAISEHGGLTHADKSRLLGAINDISRAYVGVFTTPGRILTAVKRLGGGVGTRKEADFILNPGKYVKNDEFLDILDSPYFRALQRAGGHAWINALREPDQEEMPVYTAPVWPPGA